MFGCIFSHRSDAKYHTLAYGLTLKT